MKKNGLPRKHFDVVTGNKRRFAFKPRTILVHLLLLLLVFINIFPLYWMVTFSLKDNNEILGYSTKVKVIEEVVDEQTGEVTQVEKEKRVQVLPNHVGLPQKWEWSNYTEAMKTGNMGQYFLNSLVVTVLAISSLRTCSRKHRP